MKRNLNVIYASETCPRHPSTYHVLIRVLAHDKSTNRQPTANSLFIPVEVVHNCGCVQINVTMTLPEERGDLERKVGRNH